jgi:hypothetical protein
VLFDAFGRPHPGSAPGLKKINDFNGRKEKYNFLWLLCRSSIYLDLWAQDDKSRHMCCRETRQRALSYQIAPVCADRNAKAQLIFDPLRSALVAVI